MKKILSLILFTLINVSILFGDEFIIDEPGTTSEVQQPLSQNKPSGERNYSKLIKKIGSAQTPETLSKGELSGEIGMYENGGINTRFAVGIFDIFEIGFTENFDSLIGSGTPIVNIPGAYMKLTILKNFKSIYWGIGFDSFAYGKNGSYQIDAEKYSTMYGVFTTFGWPYSFFGGSDFFIVGFRYPLLPVEAQNPTNSSLFLGLSFSAPDYFSLGITVENIFLSFDRGNRILPSLILTLKPVREFSFNFVFQYEFYSQRLNRILTVIYNTSF
ncbi:MAG: hypothetical protein ACP5QT_05530 [Brevinematia bacterium]